jgi:hypothetical protein
MITKDPELVGQMLVAAVAVHHDDGHLAVALVVAMVSIPATGVEHAGQIQPPCTRRDVGDVAAPGEIRCSRSEALSHRFRQVRYVLGPDGGPDPFALGDPQEVVVRHQALGALSIDAVAPATELGVHPKAAIGRV